MFNCQTLLEVI